MSAIAAEIQGIVRAAAEPGCAGETVGAAILRASRRLELGFSRTRAYWYGLVRTVPAEEADRLRAEAAALLDERLARLRLEQIQLQARLDTLRRSDVEILGALGGAAGRGPVAPEPGLDRAGGALEAARPPGSVDLARGRPQ